MIKKFCMMVMALCAVMMFAGCDMDGFKNPVPTIAVVDRVEKVDKLELEPKPEVETKPEVKTEYYHEDGLKDFEFGDEIWTVEVDKQCLKVSLVHYSVVGQKGEIVEVVPYWANDVDYIREVLSYGTTTIYSFAINQIYRDQYDAMVTVAELNGETFEEYWGETP